MLRRLLTILGLFFFTFAGSVSAANIKNFIESARLTPVVYVGVVREIKEVSRNKFAITAHAVVHVKAVGRASDITQPSASFLYLTYDNTLLPMDGPPEYILRPGMWVWVFSDQFDSGHAPNYLRSGTREEIAELIQKFVDSLPNLVGEKLEFNEITEAERDEQAAMYRKLAEQLKLLP